MVEHVGSRRDDLLDRAVLAQKIRGENFDRGGRAALPNGANGLLKMLRAAMAKIKLADAVRWLNDRYDADLTYQQIYMLGLQRRIPVERDDSGRFWVVDEANLTTMAKALGLVAAKKAKPAAKPKPPRPARPRAAPPPDPEPET